MRPAAVWTVPGPVVGHGWLTTVSPPPPPPPPGPTVNAVVAVVVVLALRTPSLATTRQPQEPAVKPWMVTLQMPPLADAANVWVCPLGSTMTKLTDLTPLGSVTVALNVWLVPIVAPAAGSRS